MKKNISADANLKTAYFIEAGTVKRIVKNIKLKTMKKIILIKIPNHAPNENVFNISEAMRQGFPDEVIITLENNYSDYSFEIVDFEKSELKIPEKLMFNKMSDSDKKDIANNIGLHYAEEVRKWLKSNK